jgi:hypothetical protein
MWTGADGGLKWALVHHDHGVGEMCIVGRCVARRDTGCLDGLGQCMTSFERTLVPCGEWLAPQPLNDCAIGVTAMNV